MIDLNKLQAIMYEDVEIILDHFNIEYHNNHDGIACVCPIHEGADNKKACTISPEKKSWKCWTHNCHQDYSGMLGFMMGVMSKVKGQEVEFSSALKLVCHLYNIGDKNISIDGSERVESPHREFSRLVKLFNQPKTVEENSFINSIDTCIDSQYFLSRGFTKSALDYFGVCDCVDRSSNMFMRAIIPIYNEKGVQVGYIARAMKDYLQPKYLFSEDLKSSHYLYNYHNAIGKALEKSCLFITEGQGDVWRLWECGVENVIGLFGKDISPEQERKIISSGVTTLVILTDSDQASRESKIKIQRKFTRMFTVKFIDLHKKDVGDTTIDMVKTDILSQTKGLY